MKVTPLDIRKKSFEKVTFGGYSKEEVHAFLNTLSQAWEGLSLRNQELEGRLTATLSELNRLKDMEAAFVKHLNKLEDSNNALRENAKREADLLLYETRIKANQLLEEARIKARAMIKEANQRTHQSLSEMREELRRLDYACRLLEKQRDALLREMRQLIHDTQHKIEQVEAFKRNVIYEEEIRKANELMSRQNMQVRQDLREIDNTVYRQQKNPTATSASQSSNSPSMMSATPDTQQTTNENADWSFFDAL
ncbi:MAG: DivIVA domain-containing protein [Cytophagales bacterium]|nr:DivIVA domain-containing protein [Bernardetiaceae bacterium]MDW8203712.1 DivIVA domain-containing protein [Cytophagales bacterium]